MKISINTPNAINDAVLRQFVHQKVEYALRTFGSSVQAVMVEIANTERAGNRSTHSCLIEVEHDTEALVRSFAFGESSFDCVLQAIQRLSHTIAQTQNNDSMAVATNQRTIQLSK